MGLISLLSRDKSVNLFLPAHGRGNALPGPLKKLLKLKPGIWDLPELFEIGGPLISKGAIAESQKFYASEMGVERCWYGVNGATGLLQSGLLALAKPGQSILMPRNIHQSCIHACLFGGITPILFDVPFLSDRGHADIFDRKWLRKVIKKASILDSEIVGVVLVNPTYHGYSADMQSLIEEIHSHSLPVLVDEAHGAYFISQIRSDIPSSSLFCGADIVVHSLHKSAPGLVQSAVLWLQGGKIDPYEIQRNIGLLQSSSPSSLLIASCESSLKDLIGTSGRKKLISCINKAEECSQFLKNKGVPILKNDDPLRIILHTSKFGLSGIDADQLFINKGIIGELAEPGTLTFCLGFSSDHKLAKKIFRTWSEILNSFNSQKKIPFFKRPPFDFVAKPHISSSSAWRSMFEKVNLKDCVGRISIEIICPYPPGIPLLVPGEMLDKDRVEWLIEQRNIWPDQIPDSVRVVHL